MTGPVQNKLSRPRWGLRTLAFLGLAAAAVMASNLLYAQEQGPLWQLLLTFVLAPVALLGATYCTVRGFRTISGSRPRRQ